MDVLLAFAKCGMTKMRANGIQHSLTCYRILNPDGTSEMLVSGKHKNDFFDVLFHICKANQTVINHNKGNNNICTMCMRYKLFGIKEQSR